MKGNQPGGFPHPSIADRVARIQKYLHDNPRKFALWPDRMPPGTGL